MSTDAKSLHEILNQLVVKHKLEEVVKKQEVIEKFNDIVGKHIAEQVSIKDCSNGILTIEVESSAWKNEIFLQREKIIEKINGYFGKQVVKQIRIY